MPIIGFPDITFPGKFGQQGFPAYFFDYAFHNYAVKDTIKIKKILIFIFGSGYLSLYWCFRWLLRLFVMGLFKRIYSCFFYCFPLIFFSQVNYSFEISKLPDECRKGSASVIINGTNPNDTISIIWSTGQQDITSIDNLSEGDYSIKITINSSVDTTITDTTLNFSIEKELCKIAVSNHFTPNGDGYNDVLQISYAENHPNFELDVFNKWGQRVHSQKSHYIPWDGKWAGIDVPDGTYYYVFFYDASNKNKLAKGDITILR